MGWYNHILNLETWKPGNCFLDERCGPWGVCYRAFRFQNCSLFKNVTELNFFHSLLITVQRNYKRYTDYSVSALDWVGFATTNALT